MSSNNQYTRKAKHTPEQIAENIELLTKGASCTMKEMMAKSPVKVVGLSPAEQAKAFLEVVFRIGEYVNLIDECYEGSEEGDLRLSLPGETGDRDDIIKTITAISKEKCYGSELGVLVRKNTVISAGSGRRGAYCDVDVTSWRHVLIEWDDAPIEQQLAIIGRLNLKVTSIVFSGNRSMHMLVKVDAVAPIHFKKVSKDLSLFMEMFGADRGVSNASRMTRLAGGSRYTESKSKSPVVQQLVYLNPEPTDKPILKS